MSLINIITTADRVPTTEEGNNPKFMGQALVGQWYAFGRMDQGHPPVVCLEPIKGASAFPTPAVTATHFGLLWARGCTQTKTVEKAGIYEAWHNYVTSVGRTVTKEN